MKHLKLFESEKMNEDVSPLIMFTEHEVFSIVFNIIDNKLSEEETMELLKSKLKEKGRYFLKPGDVPPGAYM